jgi:hypothetical protein
MESSSLEDRKEFVRAFVGGVSVVPGEARLDVRMRTLPLCTITDRDEAPESVLGGAAEGGVILPRPPTGSRGHH